MTIDELLQQLMKIKECYPDSGSFVVFGHCGEYEGQTIDGRRDGCYRLTTINKTNNRDEVVIT